MMIYLLLLLVLNFSCSLNNSSESKILSSEINNKLSVNNTNIKLKYISGIRSILQDRKGNYWFGSHQEGVCFFDGRSFHYFTVKDGLSDNQIRSIQEDNNGNIWFGSAKGVSNYDGKRITNYTEKSKITISYSSQNKWTKTDNDLWFGAGINPGVYRYDGQILNYLAFPTPKIINPDNTYLVTGISNGKNEMLWIGTFAGVFGYNGKEFTILNDETLGLTKETGLLHIRSVFEDSKGRLWIGNNGIGVLLKDGDTIINFSEQNNLIHPTSSRRGDKSQVGTLEHVFVINEDADGNIWFGDRDTGVWKYDGESMTNYTVDSKLIRQMVWSIYKDKKGNLLFGMADGGVYKFNGNSFERKY